MCVGSSVPRTLFLLLSIRREWRYMCWCWEPSGDSQPDFHTWTLKRCQYLDYAVEGPGLFITVGLLRERLLCLLCGSYRSKPTLSSEHCLC